MPYQIHWMKANRVLYVSYQGDQTVDTITQTLDAMAAELDHAEQPVVVLINWQEVTSMEFKALLKVKGHRAYSHPKAARGVLVGMDKQAMLENEITALKTRDSKNTQYYETMNEALEYLREMLGDDDWRFIRR